MQLFTLKNMMLATIGTSAIIAFGAVKDIQTKSVEETDEDIAFISEDVERNLASVVQTQGAKSLYLELNEINKRKIDGEWEIVRHLKNSEVVFDSSKGDGSIKTSLKLINTSTVIVANDNDQIFQVSILEGRKIALYKRLANGYEILEARKVVKVVETQLNSDTELELSLERVVLANNPSKVLKGSEIEGSVTFLNKELHNLSVSVQTESGEEKTIMINFAEIGDAGAFTVDVDGEDVSGIFFNNGNDGYRMSFVNGPLAGAQLNFMTEEKIQAKRDEELDKSYEQSFEEIEEAKFVDSGMKEQIIEANTSRNIENDQNDVYSAEEVKEIAETNGFNF